MSRLFLLCATFGLAFSRALWSVPSVVAAQPSSVHDALVGLIGAEVDAMLIASLAIEQPRTPRLGERATAASARVLDAVHDYVTAVQASVQH